MNSANGECVRLPQVSKLRIRTDCTCSVLAMTLRPLQLFAAAPHLFLVATLAVMLFRPPDADLLPYDRGAFVLLLVAVALNLVLKRRAFPFVPGLTLPMLALLALAIASALTQSYSAQNWSLLAAKLLVPFVMFHVAAVVFGNSKSLRLFRAFCFIALAYLCFVSIAFLAGIPGIVPSYITDESIGIHADRARGPFLQAVANGVTLNMLGLLTLTALRSRWWLRVSAYALLVALPFAILATMTRAVWLGFAASILFAWFLAPTRRIRKTCAGILLGGGAAVALGILIGGMPDSLQDRLRESSPIEFRRAVYEISWDMLGEKPLLGWGQGQIPLEIENRISGYRPNGYAAHNTFLEILVEHGLVGLGLYLWILGKLFRLAQRAHRREPEGEFVRELRALWPICLAVYLFNANFVVMNYQFVNALLFTLAGILVKRSWPEEKMSPYAVSV